MKQAAFLLAILSLLFSKNIYSQDQREESEPKYSFPDTTLQSLDPKKAEIAKSLVVSYTRLLAEGKNIDSIVLLCSVPFAWDRKKIISDKKEFRNTQIKLIEEKGKNRNFIIDSVYIKATRKEMIDKIIPLDIYYVMIKIRLTKEDQRSHYALFAVQMSDDPKIIGLSD